MDEIKFVEHKLYKGKVIVRFYPLSHKYFISVDGGPFKQRPGCTTIISILDKSKALESWYQLITADYLLNHINGKTKLDYDKALECAVQNEILKNEAANHGKATHEWCEAFIKHKLKLPGFKNLPKIPKGKEATIGVNSFMEIWDSKKIKPIASEKIVFSLKNDYVGTLDFDAEIDGMRSLIDFKTSNGLYNSVNLQTRGYQEAAEEEAGKRIYKQRWAWRFSKMTEEEHCAKEERKKELKAYLAKAKGWNAKEYETKPYQVFETKLLDKDKDSMKIDSEGFAHAIGLYRWNQKTSYFLNS